MSARQFKMCSRKTPRMYIIFCLRDLIKHKIRGSIKTRRVFFVIQVSYIIFTYTWSAYEIQKIRGAWLHPAPKAPIKRGTGSYQTVGVTPRTKIGAACRMVMSRGSDRLKTGFRSSLCRNCV